MKYAELPKYFVEAPLYQAKPLEDVSYADAEATKESLPGLKTKGFAVPKDLQRHCSICRSITNWRWDGIPGSAESIRTGLSLIHYRCRNCGEETFHVWILVFLSDGRVFVEKVGQWPRLEITLPADFEKALGKNKALYIKGMASRHAGYGIGALGYFRRVIDDTIADMLGVLEAAMVETGADADAIQTVRRAGAGMVFDEKVRLAAEAIPPHLKPGGMNPFANLYDLHSIALHGLSDEECCDIVDAMDEAMKYVYTELKSRTEGATRYKEAATKIHQKLRARKERRAGGT